MHLRIAATAIAVSAVAGPLDGGRLLLHFERVDYRAMVYVNGVEATDVPHENGNAPFSLDITDLVREGTNELKVCAWDPTDAGPGGTGKQTRDRDGGSFFGTVSGICGSVWTERVCETYLADWRIDADAERGTVRIRPELRGRRRDAQVEAVVSFAGMEVARGSLASGDDALEIALPRFSSSRTNLNQDATNNHSGNFVEGRRG